MDQTQLNPEPPMVSILCLAYNHEKYIRQCLDGFLMQETDFPFEVLINDDASPDGTADIIREYEQKYPSIIKPIYQKENQYSKGIKIISTYLFPRAKGKYIAFCEGDDYWIDPHKLQKQFDVMEQYPNCHLCCHNVLWVTQDGKSRHMTCPGSQYKTGLYPLVEFGNMTILNFFHLNSLFVRYEDYKTYIEESPAFKKIYEKEVGDSPLFLYMAQLGESYYISDIMSHYRPWSNEFAASLSLKSVSSKISETETRIQGIKEYDKYTQYKFHNACLCVQQSLEIRRAALSGQYRLCLSIGNKKIFKTTIQAKRWRLKIYIGAYFPKLIAKYDAWKKAKQSANS